MKLWIKTFILTLTVLLGWGIASFALASEDVNQKILDLRKQIEELEKQAAEYKGGILSKQKEAQTLKREIDTLNAQLQNLQTGIKITGYQIDSTRLSIQDLQNKIFDRQAEIVEKQQAVAFILNLIYQNDQENLLTIILKNDNLSDFVSQTQQADNLNRKLLATITVVKNEKEQLEADKIVLEGQKTELERLNATQKNKQNALSGVRFNKNSLLAKTKGQEAVYQQMLTNVEAEKAKFFSELKQWEARALASGAFIVHVTADKIPPRGTKILQWPEDDFVITQGYGYTSYARRGAYGGAPHNGVDIAGGMSTAINPVMSGKILASGFNDGFGNWVAVLHDGGLVSLYGHMRVPSGLSNGTPVSIRDVIGYEGSTGNSTGSHLHLSIYRDFFTYINEKNGQLYFNYFDGTLNPLNYL